jgi:3-dehydroquinate dehydratase
MSKDLSLLKSIQKGLSDLHNRLKKEAFRLNSYLEPEERRKLQGIGMDLRAAYMNLNQLIKKLEGEKWKN